MNNFYKEKFYAESLEDYRNNIWKKHPEENAEAYDFFIRYYVHEERPIDAYRLFLLDIGEKETEEEANAINRLDTKYSNYEKARNEEGYDIKGLDHFKDRKSEFLKTGLHTPPRLTPINTDNLDKMRVSVIKQELLDVELLHNQWLIQLALFSEHVEKQKEDNVSANNQNSTILGNLIKARKDISFLERRAVGMTDKAEDTAIEEALNEEVEIVYEEKVIETNNWNEIDFMTEEQFDEFMKQEGLSNRLANG